MLVLWAVHDRCTAGTVSEISKSVAIPGSSEEVERVLFDRGQRLDIKTIRAPAYGFAMCACAAQRVGSLNWEILSRVVEWSSPPMAAGFDSHEQMRSKTARGETAIARTARAEVADHLRGG